MGKKVKYTAKLVSSKTNPNMVGRIWTLFESDGKTSKWSGIPEMQKREI
jgi:hypothetical protein